MDFRSLTIASFHDGLIKKEFSALEATQAYFTAIKAEDKNIGAFLSTREDAAIKEAEAADLKIAEAIRSGDTDSVGAMTGTPIALKDNMLIEGGVTTAGSRILERYTASYDAGVVTKLKASGAVILGKTNLDEFAMGSSTENSAYHVTKNPHDTTRVAGGSSGGSAASIAANFALGALGSDTGGSIRQPASLTGVVGMKPTYGAVSRSGLIALASSLDQIGPFAKTVEDAAILFDTIKGYDTMDATSVRHDYGKSLRELSSNTYEEKIKGLTIGIPNEYFVDGMEPEVLAAIEDTIKSFEKMGVKTKRISLPHTKHALSCYYIILPAEVSANIARLDGIRYSSLNAEEREGKTLKELYLTARGKGFGPETKRRIILGTFVLSSGYYDAYYGKAQAVRNLISADFDNAFKDVDVILTPVSPTRAFKIGEKSDDPLAMYLSDIFTIPVNLAGLPGISIPVKGIQGLPIGFQLIGKHWHEADILGLGRLYERT
jgi:aspartyl-tRNA(Asn)/glutamyl-tRNA(Gln) amidotransferase subunit A